MRRGEGLGRRQQRFGSETEEDGLPTVRDLLGFGDSCRGMRVRIRGLGFSSGIRVRGLGFSSGIRGLGFSSGIRVRGLGFGFRLFPFLLRPGPNLGSSKFLFLLLFFPAFIFVSVSSCEPSSPMVTLTRSMSRATCWE